MPAAIPIIIAIGTKAAAWVVALTIASAAYTYIAMDEARDKARRRFNDSLQDRRLLMRGGTSPRRWALGRVRLGGALVYADTVGINKRQFDSELALCNGPIDAVEGYWLNDEYFPASEVSANRPTVGKYSAPATQSTTTEQRTVSGSTFTLTHAPVSGSVSINMDQGADNGYISLTGFTVVGNTITLAAPINNVVYCDYAYISADAPLLIQWVLGGHSAAMSWPGVTTPNRGASDKGLGVASIRTLMGWDENLYQSGAPVVNALVRGIKVPDPRTGTTVWTSNPALLAAWWATLPRVQGGCGRPPESINTASVIAAANICDELITVRKRDGSGYEQIKRYECHTVLSTEASPEANLRTILEAMAGEFPFTSGQYVLVAGAFRAPSLVLTDADVAAGQPIRISPNTGGFDAIPNMVTATFADSAQSYVETSAPDVVNDTYVEDDGGAEEPLALGLSATTDARQANYLMGVALERTRPGFAAELTVKGVGANIALLQGLTINLQGYEAFASKTWEVRARTNNFNGTYTLRLAETKANIWALDADRYTPTSVPTPPDLSYLWSVANVANLAATAGQPTELPDGTVVTRVSVTWDGHAQDYVRQSGAIELRYRRVESTTYAAVPELPGSATATTITLGATANARYIIEARARNGVGAVSTWVVVPLDVVVGSVASNITARLTSPGVTLSADAAGVVQSYVGAITAVQILVDGLDVTHLWTKIPTPSSGITASMVGAVLTVTAMADATAAGYVDVLCTRAGWPDQPLRYGITKVKSGAAGNYIDHIFIRSASMPATPTGAGLPAGWADAPPSGTDPLYMSVAEKTAAGALVGGWAAPARLDGQSGANGDSVSVEYSVDGSTSWHATFASGDKYMRQRIGSGSWSAAIRIVGEDGAAGNYIDHIFIRSASPPATPTGAGLPAGWADAPPSGTDPLYMSVAEKTAAGALVGGWAAPARLDGQSGANGDSVSVEYSVDGSTSWHATFASGDKYMRQRIGSGSWSAAIKIVGEQGSPGVDALVFELSSESVTLAATSAGVVTSYAGASTTIAAKRGSAVEDGWSYSKVDSAGLTTSIAGNVITVTAMSDASDKEYVDITPSRAGYPVQQPRRFDVTKTRSAVGTSGPLSGWYVGAYATDFTSPYSMSATVTFTTTGAFQSTATNQATQTGYWFAPSTSGIGSSYWVKVIKLSGDTPTGSALDTWLPLSSDCAFTLSGSTNKLGQYAVKVATSASDAAIVGSGFFDLGCDNGV